MWASYLECLEEIFCVMVDFLFVSLLRVFLFLFPFSTLIFLVSYFSSFFGRKQGKKARAMALDCLSFWGELDGEAREQKMSGLPIIDLFLFRFYSQDQTVEHVPRR